MKDIKGRFGVLSHEPLSASSVSTSSRRLKCGLVPVHPPAASHRPTQTLAPQIHLETFSYKWTIKLRIVRLNNRLLSLDFKSDCAVRRVDTSIMPKRYARLDIRRNDSNKARLLRRGGDVLESKEQR
jgi:hypothetical protein